ncbi:MAG TPA: amidohydrolase family protein [bacterium]|nr:amidohydrolase family protein [bacterium]
MNSGAQTDAGIAMGGNMPLVIDVHVHLFAMSEKNGAIIGDKVRRNPIFKILISRKYGYKGNDEEFDRNYVEKVAREVRESKTTDKAVFLALDGIYDSSGRLDTSRTEVYIPNEYCRKVCMENPAEFLYAASVNPDRADALDELDRAKAGGAVLVKWLPNSQDFNPSESKYIPFYKKLAELKLPLLSHTGYEHCIKVTDQLLGDPMHLRSALDEGVTVIAGHCGTSGRGHPHEFFDDYLEMLGLYPNLFGDLAAITSLTRFNYISKMLKHPGFMDRHVHATDYPSPPLPLLFPAALGIRKALSLSFVGNTFDRDVETKRALGFPEQVFTRAESLLGLST